VDVPEVDGGLRADDRELAPREAMHELPLRGADAPELADVALEVEDLLEDVGGLRLEDLALDGLDALLEEIEVGDVPLEELVEDPRFLRGGGVEVDPVQDLGIRAEHLRREPVDPPDLAVHTLEVSEHSALSATPALSAEL